MDVYTAYNSQDRATPVQQNSQQVYQSAVQSSQQPQQTQQLYGHSQSSPMMSAPQPVPYGQTASPANFGHLVQDGQLLGSPQAAYTVPAPPGNQYSLSPPKAVALAAAAAVGAVPYPSLDPAGTGSVAGQPNAHMHNLHSSPQMAAARPRHPSQPPAGLGHAPAAVALPRSGHTHIHNPQQHSQHPLMEQVSIPTDESPLYVNAKQFHRIMKRRVARQRIQERLRQIDRRERPSYIHKSRHLHAMRRPRGPGGRFLTSDEVAARRQKEGSEGVDGPDGPDGPDSQADLTQGDQQQQAAPAEVVALVATLAPAPAPLAAQPAPPEVGQPSGLQTPLEPTQPSADVS